MTTRIIFTSIPEKPYYKTRTITFSPVARGLARTQVQKNIRYVHELFMRNFHGEEPLEISTASLQPEGVQLSAFNLKWNRTDGKSYYVENIFQSAKKFEHGGPYMDLLDQKPGSAKKDDRLRSGGRLQAFVFDGREYPLIPRNAFYDWIYMNALETNGEQADQLMKYNHFSDYYFNPEKSLNCQAQAAAIYAGLKRSSKLDVAMSDFDTFIKTIWD